jgi:hypothetical protein
METQGIKDLFNTVLTLYKSIDNENILEPIKDEHFLKFVEKSYTKESIVKLQEFLASLSVRQYMIFALTDVEFPTRPELECNQQVPSVLPEMTISQVAHLFIAMFKQNFGNPSDNSNTSHNPLSTKVN